MNIRLIKNSDNAICAPLGKDVLLQVNDANYQLLNRKGKRLFVLNTKSNERYEISPEVKKYHFTDIEYAAFDHDYIFYTSAESITESQVAIKIYRYTYDTNESQCVYVFDVQVEKLNNSNDFMLFALDESHFIFETFEQDGSFKAIIRNIDTDIDVPIRAGIVAELGLFKIVPLVGNKCMIKLGAPSTDKKEIVATVNVKQFISELLIEGIKLNFNELDTADGSMTIPYMRHMDDRVLYSKCDYSRCYEEIVMYDYMSDVKKVRINTDEPINDDELNYTCNISGEIYLIKQESDGTQFISMNTGKTEYKLPLSMTFRYIKGDIVVVSRSRKRLLSRQANSWIEVYNITDMSRRLYKIRGNYKDCVVNGDDLVIFTK